MKEAWEEYVGGWNGLEKWKVCKIEFLGIIWNILSGVKVDQVETDFKN